MRTGRRFPPIAGVTELGYIGLGVRDLDVWKVFASEILGLEVVPDPDKRACTLRMDYWHYRFVLQESGTDDIAFAGWRVAGNEAFEAVADELRKADIPYQIASPAQADERQVLGLMTLADPAGLQTEIFYGPRIEASRPFRPGRGMHGRFETGAKGLGHFVTDTSETARCAEFYSGILGMRGSVEFELQMPGKPTRSQMHFYSCNSRQHSIAFADLGTGKRLSHIMTEVSHLEDVGLTRDLVRSRRVPIRLDIGQHHNDRAVSFYFTTPSGWDWEVGWGVAEPSGQAEWGTGPIWGHEYLPSRETT